MATGKLVECVPNFSEGRNRDVIDAIAAAIRGTEGCTLLDIDPGNATNRTVYTFVGSPDAVVEGALNAAKVARRLIDMRKHKGAHPRCGAMDVCPFVPVRGVTMEDCVACALRFGKRLAEEQGIPAYLYGEACQKGDHRKTLSQIRAGGEYEGIFGKAKKPSWEPDFGSTTVPPESGVTCAGARFFLIAYNVNILGTKEQAMRIAYNIRSEGRREGQPGRCQRVKGIGWWIDEYNLAQVSMNLDDYRVTPPHVVFEECCKDAEEMKIGVAGSELVGLIPLEALMLAADYYIKKEGLLVLEEKQKVLLAAQRLGLSSVKPFDPKKQVIEYMVEEKRSEPLASMSVRRFVEEVGARTATPGGGSVAALGASLGMALANMMAWMTFGNREWEELDPLMRQLIPPIYHGVRRLIPMIDADASAFDAYMNALKLPHTNDEEKKIREQAMEDGMRQAVEAPLSVMRMGGDKLCWNNIVELARVGNIKCQSDLEVGVLMLEAGIHGAWRNVEINLHSIKDGEWAHQVLTECQEIMAYVREKKELIMRILEERRHAIDGDHKKKKRRA